MRTATESTNTMFITGILSQKQDVLVITMTGNQFGAQFSTGFQRHTDQQWRCDTMMLFKRAKRTNAPNMGRDAFAQLPDQSE